MDRMSWSGDCGVVPSSMSLGLSMAVGRRCGFGG
jgi:hypothetical protein